MFESFILIRNYVWILVVFLVLYEMEKRKKIFRYNYKFVCYFGIGFICCREGVFFDS